MRFWTKDRTPVFRTYKCCPRRKKKRKKKKLSIADLVYFLFCVSFCLFVRLIVCFSSFPRRTLEGDSHCWTGLPVCWIDKKKKKNNDAGLSPALVHSSEWAFTVSWSPTRVVLFLRVFVFSFCFHFQNVFFLRKYVALFTKHSGFFIQLKGILFAHIYDLVSMAGRRRGYKPAVATACEDKNEQTQGNACFPSKTSGSQKEPQVTGHK